MRTPRKLDAAGHAITVYPDAEHYIRQQLWRQGIEQRVAGVRAQPDTHPLRTSLLNVELLPYQLEGIAFAVGAGRAVLAELKHQWRSEIPRYSERDCQLVLDALADTLARLMVSRQADSRLE